jgi:hypothetical protein
MFEIASLNFLSVGPPFLKYIKRIKFYQHGRFGAGKLEISSREIFRYNYGVVNAGREETLKADARDIMNAELKYVATPCAG